MVLSLLKKFAPVILIAGFAIFALLGIREVNAQRAFLQTDAVITAITVDNALNDKDPHHVTVSYTVQGKNYSSELGFYSASMKEGDEIAIKYNPDAPEQITKAGITGALMFFGMAALCLISAAIVIIKKMNGRL